MSLILRKANTFLSKYIKGTINYQFVRHFRPLSPTIFHFPVTYRCNGRCVMCDIWKQSDMPELTIDEIEKMLKDPLFRTIRNVTLTGGEPTLRNDLGEITKLLIKYCKNLTTICITTNGLISSRVIKACEETLKACKGTKTHVGCSVSLDGLNEYHDKVRGVKNAFDKTKETVFLLKELQKNEKINVSCQATISKWNIDSMHDLKNWFEENEIQSYFAVAHYSKTDVSEEFDLVEERQYLQKYIIFLEHLKKNGEWDYLYEFFWNALRNNRKREILCPFSVEAISVTPNGNMSYCTGFRTSYLNLSHQQTSVDSNSDSSSCAESKSIGNIHVRTPTEIYYDKKNIRYRQRLQKTMCPTCLQTCAIESSLVKHPLALIRFKLRTSLERYLP